MIAGVIRAADTDAERTPSGARIRIVAGTGAGAPADRPGGAAAGRAGGRLLRRLVDVPPGAQFRGTAGPAGDLWFIITGQGRLEAGGQAAISVGRDQGLRLPAGARYWLRAAGPSAMQLDTVSLPADPSGSPAQGSEAGPGSLAPPDDSRAVAGDGAAALLVTRLEDCPAEITGDRRFRVLFGPGRGCAAATQFIGEIPPGRAPDHSHRYDEVVLVLAGHGLVHAGSAAAELDPGTCVHLPPGQQHCLENTGQATLVVLGVFYPGGSPAARDPARDPG